jgi:hypothetical protein
MTITITIGETPINATYSAVTGTTSGSGTGAKFIVTKTNGVYTTTIDSANLGTGYAPGDTITIPGASLGGVTGANNDILTVATVGVGGKIATFGTVGTGRIGSGVNTTTIAVSGTSDVDTYTFTGKSTDFTVTNDTTNKNITAASLLDTSVTFKLADHERVVFSDKATAFDITGHAGDVYALLKASIGGTVNPTYEGLGIKLEDSGLTSTQVAQAIINTSVFATAAGGTGNDSFVRQVYTNVIGTVPTLAQAKPFVDALNAGTMTQASLLVAAAHLDTFDQAIGLVGVNGATGVLAGTGIDFIPA